MEHFDFNFHLQSRGSLFHVFVFLECVAAPRRLVVIAGVRHHLDGRFGATRSKHKHNHFIARPILDGKSPSTAH